MRNIVFDMSNMHAHGSAFYDFLKLRKRFFVDGMNWKIPHDGTVEMDQYDTPAAHYSLVEQDGVIVAGARCQPLLSQWGRYSSQLRDATLGVIEGIPNNLIDLSKMSDTTWEGTRLVVSDHIRSPRTRAQCIALVIDGLMRVIEPRGGTSFLTLSPPPLHRTVTYLGVEATRISQPYVCSDDDREYAVFDVRVERNISRLKQMMIDPDRHEVIASPIQAAE